RSASPLPRDPLLFSSSALPHRALHSFPTRRSSDLRWPEHNLLASPLEEQFSYRSECDTPEATFTHAAAVPGLRAALRKENCSSRSEEYTSELQSPYDLVCRLLLEKKKKQRRSQYKL